MKNQIRLLLVEDNEDDAILIINQFRENGYTVEYLRVWTKESMSEALKTKNWDAITCDHAMPSFDSVSALNVLASSGLDLPFIIISGSIGEVKAVEVMKAGAHDYIVKGALERLVAATEREIREARRREVQRRMEHSQQFMVSASAILISSLDYGQTLKGILNLIVPNIADCCVINLFDTLGSQAESYCTHIEKEKEDQLLELQSHYPFNPNWPFPSLLIPQIETSDFLFQNKTQDYFKKLIILGFHSAMHIPFYIRGKIIGAIIFLNIKKEFDNFDLDLAQELAQHSSIAIDNAHLYQKSLEEIQLRNDFLMTAAHELRTPITSVRLKLQTLLRSLQRTDQKDISVEKIIDSLKFSDQQIDRFIRLIEVLLNVSKISKKGIFLNREYINLAEIIAKIAQQFSEELIASGSHLDIDIKDSIIGYWDPLQIEKTLVNILSNAIKYGLGQTIKISASLTDSTAIITVEDHGLGISKKDRLRIFNRFERAVSLRSYSGLGLGLYIAHQIVKAHGGTLMAESELGKGSKFIIELPLGL